MQEMRPNRTASFLVRMPREQREKERRTGQRLNLAAELWELAAALHASQARWAVGMDA